MKDLLDTIRQCSKDEESFLKLRQIFRGLEERAETYREYLDLLERSVRNDYDAILITDLNLEKPGPRIVYVNDGFTRITGYQREEVIGKSPRILQGEKTDRTVLDKLRKRLSEGEPFYGHTVNYRKDGSEFVNQWDIHPLTDETGEITHWVSYQHDITERKRSERTVVDTEVEFDSLHEEAKSTKVDLNEDGSILSANRSFRELLGYDIEELKQKKIWELVPQGQADSVQALFTPFRPEQFDDRGYDLTIVSRDGEEVEMFASSRLLSSEGRQVARFKLSNRSLQKRIVKMLRKRNQYDELLDKKSEFGYRLCERDGEFYYDWISDSFSYITGIDEERLRGGSVRDFIVEEDWPKVRRHIEKVMSGHSSTEVYHMKTHSGEPLPVIDSANPQSGKNNAVEAVRGSVCIEISSEQKGV